jgi:tetratricopeptide (TPR) repeat protein
MQINTIDNFDAFVELKANWNSVYQGDRNAHFFMSWEWLSGWLQMVREPWVILAAKPTDIEIYVAFFPLKVAVEQDRNGGLTSQLFMVGNSLADYTGFICVPEYELTAIAAFQKYIFEELKWSLFNLGNLLKAEERMGLFLSKFPKTDVLFRQVQIKNQDQEPDHSIAPFVLLADRWDDYLQHQVSSNTRQKIRRFLRKIDDSEEYRIAEVDEANLSSHIEILLNFWQTRWGEKKSKDCDVIVEYFRAILNHCFKLGCLYLPVLWKGDRPLGAIANLMDFRKQTALFLVAGRDESFKSPPPGLILHAHAIRHAIQNGFKIYDFLRGNEPYKYSFGAQERHLAHIVLERQHSSPHLLDVRTVPVALEMATQKLRENQLSGAEKIYRQILANFPHQANALYGLGVLAAQANQLQEAETLFKELLKIQPNSAKAWFSLGNLHQSQERYFEAIAAYHHALEHKPDFAFAYNNLGYAEQQLGHWEQAIAAYRKALELEPDCSAAQVNCTNAIHQLHQQNLPKPSTDTPTAYELNHHC